MVFHSFWQKWRRRLLTLFFIVQYHFRMSFLNLRYKTRGFSRSEINVHARGSWNALCQALTDHLTLKAGQKRPHEQITAALRLTRQKFTNQEVQNALSQAKKRLEKVVFVDDEETPTQPLDLSTLKTVWNSLDTGKIPRVTSAKLKTAWNSFETGTLPRIIPKKGDKQRQPGKLLKALRHPKMTLLTFALLSLLLIPLCTFDGITSQTFRAIKSVAISTAPQLLNAELNPVAQHTTNINASKALMRLSQLDVNEYASQSEYNTWAYSACSTASLTEVINAYGYHYRITDVLKVESAIGEITPQLGLLENVGIAKTAARFGFQTTWGNSWTLAQVKDYANAGQPVIVGWPPSRYPAGHIVVVTGGDANNVFLADSSLWNRHVLTNAQFLQWWGGFAAVVTPE